MRQLELEYGWPTETAAELVEPGKKPTVEPSKKSIVEEKLVIQRKPHRGKWGRRFIIATGVLATLYLAWNYLWPLLRAFALK